MLLGRTAPDPTWLVAAAPPRLGDLRVSWMQIAPRRLTVLARAQNGVLLQTGDASGKPLAQVQIGKRSLVDVIPDAPQPPHLVWLRRALAVLLAWAGVLLLRPPRRDPPPVP